MPRATWQAASDGAYWIDVAVGSRELTALIDLGLIDSTERVGVSVQPAVFDQMRQAGEFTDFFDSFRLDASGGVTRKQNGQATAQLICPITRQRIGPSVTLYVARGAPAIPDRVGIVFFHFLAACHVFWHLDQRLWCIDYP
jgi:hypothetical protein